MHFCAHSVLFSFSAFVQAPPASPSDKCFSLPPCFFKTTSLCEGLARVLPLLWRFPNRTTSSSLSTSFTKILLLVSVVEIRCVRENSCLGVIYNFVSEASHIPSNSRQHRSNAIWIEPMMDVTDVQKRDRVSSCRYQDGYREDETWVGTQKKGKWWTEQERL